jgi:hypothetical protein
LGALFGLVTSPCARGPVFSLLALVGIPWMTFAIAAPKRMSLGRQFGLFFADAEAMVLAALSFVGGRRDAAADVVGAHRSFIERSYTGTSAAELVSGDPLRLHHARRVAMMVTTMAVGSALAVPLVFSSVFTYGSGVMAVGTFILDLVVLAAVTRVVAERAALRLAEASIALGAHLPHARLRLSPLFAMLGGTMGLIGGMLVLLADGAASAVESLLFLGRPMVESFVWFVAAMGGLTMVVSVALGALMGVAMALAQPAQPRD